MLLDFLVLQIATSHVETVLIIKNEPNETAFSVDPIDFSNFL